MSLPSWDFLKEFHIPSRSRSFADFGVWVELGRRVARERLEELPALRAQWNDRLAFIGGDPSQRDWARFRPLRLSREEDWSDWLAELLESSESGVLAAALFKPSAESGAPFARPEVKREARVLDGHRRADLVVSWSAQPTCFHVEVKIKDESLLKTHETASALQREHATRGKVVEHFILLPQSLMTLWEDVDQRDAAARIGVITWRDVAVALRRVLWLKRENVMWRVWAAAFVGAIENQILGIEHTRLEGERSLSTHSLAGGTEWARILRVAMAAEDENGKR